MLRYAGAAEARKLLAQSGILGVAGYGAGRPEFLPPGCPFVPVPLCPASGGEMFEIWAASSPVRYRRSGRVAGAYSGDAAFGVVALEERNASLEDAVEQAYLQIFDFLEETGFPAPLRFWNYLTAITGDDRGMERYRRFNIGRARAFTARLKQSLPPAASGVGGHWGASMIYFLGGRESAKPVENPRQVSAYAYPPIYGPASPSFSRASVHQHGDAQSLFISGTASISGHETRHRGDLHGQIAETMENLRAVIGAAEQAAAGPVSGDWALKVYLHDPRFRAAADPAIDAMFGPGSARLYLHADICRPDLLLEIEAFRHSGDVGHGPAAVA